MSCRILYVIGQLRSGGSERQLNYLLKSMDRNRYHPEVVVGNLRETDTYVSQIRALGVPLHSFPAASSRTMKLKTFRPLNERLVRRHISIYSQGYISRQTC